VSAEATGNLTNVALGTCRASDLSKIVSIVSDAPAGGYPVGTTIVTWSATDALGNVGTGIQKVTIADTTPPVIRAPSDVATDAINGNPAIATLGTASASDIFAVTVSNDAPATYSVGTTTVTWTAVDANGNTASATQRVIVALLDTLPPVVTAPPDVFATSSGGNTAVNLGAASANDNIDGMVAVSSNAPAAFPTGVTIVTYTAADAAGNTGTAVQRVIVSYLPIAGGGGGTVITQPPVPGGGATAVAESVYWHHNDHLGTPQALTDANQRVVWTMSQTPFGIGTVNEDPDGDGITVTNNFRFPGQYFDAETGLNYNYQRTYDPLLGRYTQSDPIGLQGGMNTFGYVNGNPVIYVDPFGLEQQFTIGIGGIIGGNPFIGMPGFFGGGGLNVGFTTSGQILVQFQATGSLGVGVFAGIGVEGQVSKSECQTQPGISVTHSPQGDVNFGAGPSVGGSVQYSGKNAGIQTGVGKLGVGFGFQASGGVNQTVTIATPALFPDNSPCGCKQK